MKFTTAEQVNGKLNSLSDKPLTECDGGATQSLRISIPFEELHHSSP